MTTSQYINRKMKGRFEERFCSEFTLNYLDGEEDAQELVKDLKSYVYPEDILTFIQQEIDAAVQARMEEVQKSLHEMQNKATVERRQYVDGDKTYHYLCGYESALNDVHRLLTNSK